MILKLISLEWKKLRFDLTFRIIMTIFFIALPLLVWTVKLMFDNTGNPVGRSQMNAVYNFPQVFRTVAYWASHLSFYTFTFLAISTVTSEYRYRTLRQNVIDGLDRSQIVLGKLLLALLLTSLATVYVNIVAFCTGLIMDGFGGDMFSQLFWASGQFFLQLLSYVSLAMVLAFLIRRTALTAILFFAYILILERILVYVLFQNGLAAYEAGAFLPASTFWALVPITWLTDAFPIVKEISTSEGYNKSILGGGTILAISFIYILICWGISFWTIKKRDL